MACQCRTNADGTTTVCDPCASQMMAALLGILPEEDQKLVETPTVLTAVEYRGMQNAVNFWLNELEVATR